MANAIAVSLESLRTTSPKLNKATDQIDALVERVETFLNEACSIGLPVEVGDEYEDFAGGTTRTALTYQRMEGKFRIGLVVERLERVTDEDGEEGLRLEDGPWLTSWSKCSRVAKLKAFDHLPELVAMVATEATKMLTNATATSKTVAEMLDALDGASKPKAKAKASKPKAKAKDSAAKQDIAWMAGK